MRMKRIEVPSSITTYENALQHIADQFDVVLSRQRLGEIEVLEELIRSIHAKRNSVAPGALLNTLATAVESFSPTTYKESEKKKEAIAYIKGAQFALLNLNKKESSNR